MKIAPPRLVILILVVAGLSSCVSNKRYIYLQQDDVNKEGLPLDTAVRSYTLKPFKYKLQTNDIVSVRYESLTPKEYNFFSPEAQNGTANLNLTSQSNALLVGEIIDEDGRIPVPAVGKVKIGGLTLFEAQDSLQKIADIYLENPIVKVRLLNYRVTVLGEVAKEGLVQLSNNRVSLIEAIGIAGGLGELADRSKIKLIRQDGSKTTVYYVDILSEQFIRSPLYYVHQNDILIVPPLKQRAFRRYFSPNFAIGISAATLLLLVYTYSRNN